LGDSRWLMSLEELGELVLRHVVPKQPVTPTG
jgi:hypothetical protein